MNVTTNSIVDDDGLIITAAVELENVGKTALKFSKEDQLRVYVQQVWPLSDKIEKKLIKESSVVKAPAVRGIGKADNWTPIAFGEQALESILETDEREVYYIRTRVDCIPNMRYVVDARVRKPSGLSDRVVIGESYKVEEADWIRQSELTRVSSCIVQ